MNQVVEQVRADILTISFVNGEPYTTCSITDDASIHTMNAVDAGTLSSIRSLYAGMADCYKPTRTKGPDPKR